MEIFSQNRKRFAPSADRTRHAILEALREILPRHGKVLEIASGTGQHAVHFAEHLPGLIWQPSDIEPVFLESIHAWQEEAQLPNLLPPLRLDVTAGRWPVDAVDAIFCSNMVHIAPWQATEGLMAGAGRTLRDGGCLVLYGAYFIQGRPAAPSNRDFDVYLRSQDPSWGVRDLEEVTAEAARNELELDHVRDMEGNNFLVVFREQPVQTATKE